MDEPVNSPDEQALRKMVVKIQARGWGVAFGLVLGVGLFLATIILVIKGGWPVGPRLGLLSVYMPGYRVTLVGSVIGFGYAFVAGYVIGWSIASIYNRLTTRL